MTFGWPHRHYRRVDSTNARARELAAAGAPGGTVVTAAEQTAGRGRQGRTWTAPGGKALLYSAILRPLGDRQLLPLAVALAACEAAEDLAPGARCRIKWPNDVWIGERKLAGILIETKTPSRDSAHATREPRAKRGEDEGRPNSSAVWPTEDAVARSVRRQARTGRLAAGIQKEEGGWAVIGVGLNLTVEPHELPSDLGHPATSLAIAAAPGGHPAAESGRAAADTDSSTAATSHAPPSPHRGRLALTAMPGAGGRHLTPRRAAVALDARLGEWVDAEPARVLAAYRKRDALRGREIAWSAGPDLDAVDGSGVAAGIDDRGGLVVRLPGGGDTVLFAGEVHLRL